MMKKQTSAVLQNAADFEEIIQFSKQSQDLCKMVLSNSRQ